MARQYGVSCLEVEKTARMRDYDPEKWGHVWTCPNSRMTVESMEKLVKDSELVIGRKPAVVMADYAQLIQGGKGSRYERMSTIAEDLKRMARETGTVLVVASQVGRKEEDINLHSAKDSGSLENSCQLVLGASRPTENTMRLTVLKQTRRAGVFDIECHYDGDRQTITEMAGETGCGL